MKPQLPSPWRYVQSAFNRTFWYWNSTWADWGRVYFFLQSHLLVLKLAAWFAAFEWRWTFNRTFWYWNTFPRRGGWCGSRPSIAPFGIETKKMLSGIMSKACLQSHLLVLKHPKRDAAQNYVNAFNRTFWYWNSWLGLTLVSVGVTFNRTFWYWNFVFRPMKRLFQRLQSHLLVLKPKIWIILRYILGPSIAPFGIETTRRKTCFSSRLEPFNRTFWYWNYERDSLIFTCLSPSIAPFGIETLHLSSCTPKMPWPSIAPFGIETYCLFRRGAAFAGLQSHLLVLKPKTWIVFLWFPFAFNRTFWYWKSSEGDSGDLGQQPSIAPFGIESSRVEHIVHVVHPLQSHLLVLKGIKLTTTPSRITAFNRTFWYWK